MVMKGYTEAMDAADFIQQSPVRSFAKGQAILCEGEASKMLFFIRSGYVKVTSLDKTGSEHVLWIAASDDIIPSEHFFSLQTTLRYFYTALTPVSAWAVDKATLLRAARRDIKLMATIAASLSDNYDDLLLRVAASDESTIHDRLRATLTYLAQRFGKGESVDLHKIGLPLTHHDIAEMIGSTRETTSIELEKMQKQHLISYDRSRFVIYLKD